MNKKYEELEFTDDFFFCKILMKNKNLCKELLELILEIKIKDIVFSAEQKPIELTAGAKRSRYYQGMIDLNLIDRGADYKDLKKSFVIFICLSDLFDKGLHIYTFENRCKQYPKLCLGDETAKVFINASGTANDVSDEMKAFLDYLKGKGSSTNFTRRIEEEVNKARAHEEWRVEYMSLFLRDMDMREEGRDEARRTVVMNMLKENEPVEKICRYAECDEVFVKEVKKELLNSEQ